MEPGSCASVVYKAPFHGVQPGQFFRIFEIIIFCFVVAICDLVHASGNLF